MVKPIETIPEGVKHIHCIGIGGSGMFPLVQILHGRGYTITGSDNNESDIVELERQMGIEVMMGQRAENIQGADLILYSAAIMDTNPELIAARESGLPLWERAKMLGAVSSWYSEALGVCGTHGKTTTTAKLAGYMKKFHSKRPLLAACDVYRPAAIEQLKVVGGQLGLPVFEEGQGDPVKIAENALRYARDHGNDLVFLDTAGRLHVDEALMDELKRMKAAVHPNEILLVVDAMTGQDAVNAATAFDQALGIDGVMLTKLDGDARGGAALSIKAATGKPIKFVGTGEKLDMIEPFHPDRMASRILGMGDMLSFIEKAQQTYDEKQAKKLEEKLKKNSFTLSDYFDQLQQIRNMGDLSQLAGMMPGNLGSKLQGAQIDEKAIAHTEAIILSMTPEERENPQILGASRKKRIAAGCGLDVVDVNRLLKQFEGMQQIIKQVTGGRKPGFGFGGLGHGRGLRKRKKK